MYGFVESLTLLSQRLNARRGEGVGKRGLSSRAEVREKERGEYRFSSLVKQNKKAKNYAVFCFAGFCFLNFLCYEVIVKQKIYKRFASQ